MGGTGPGPSVTKGAGPLLSGADVRALLERAGTQPRRSLGQNFVTDPNTVRRIARLAGVGPGDRVVEIGAGLGSLTLALAHTGARVLAVETDRRLVPILQEVTGGVADRVTVLHADARRVSWQQLLCDTPAPESHRQPSTSEAGTAVTPTEAGESEHCWHLVANLPYNIATSLVLTVLDEAPAVTRLLAMCQREAAERLAADPGSGAYGAVSVRVALHARAELAGAVPATVFYPRPEVESALVRITRRCPPVAPDLRAEVSRLVNAAFAHRRQMLRRTLRDALRNPDEVLAAAGIDPTDRPERLGLASWVRLAELSLAARGSG